MRIFVWSFLFTQYGYGDNQDGATGLRSYPLDYVYSGYYYWHYGRLYTQGINAFLWSSTILSGTHAYRFGAHSVGVHPVESNGKVRGNPLRCSI